MKAITALLWAVLIVSVTPVRADVGSGAFNGAEWLTKNRRDSIDAAFAIHGRQPRVFHRHGKNIGCQG